LGSRERADQVVGNVSNTIIMLRVADLKTAELLSERLGQVEVNMLMLVSAATDSSEPDSPIHFTSTMQDRVSTQRRCCWKRLFDATPAWPYLRPDGGANSTKCSSRNWKRPRTDCRAI